MEAGCLDGAKVAAGAHCGGKLDDISCVLSRCVLAGSANQQSASGTVAGKTRGGAGVGSSGSRNSHMAAGIAKTAAGPGAS